MTLKTCIKELKISQKTVAEGIGWSRTALNLFLNSGRLPVDAERFKAGVRRYLEQNPAIEEWLLDHGVGTEMLFITPPVSTDLEEVILDMVGYFGMYGPTTDVLHRFARTSQFLLEHLRAITETAEIEAEAASMLGMKTN